MCELIDEKRDDIKKIYVIFFFFQAKDGIRDLVRSRGLGDVYKRQGKAGSNSRLAGESTTR